MKLRPGETRKVAERWGTILQNVLRELPRPKNQHEEG